MPPVFSCAVPKALFEEYSCGPGATGIACRKGLEPAVHSLLAQHRRQVRTVRVGPETVSFPPPHPAPWIGRPPYTDAVEWMHQCESGLLIADPGRFRIDRLVQAVSLAFPSLTIAIASDSLDRLRHLSLQLERLGQTTRVFTAGNNLEDRPRVCYARFMGLAAPTRRNMIWFSSSMRPKHSASERNSRSATRRERDSLGFSLRAVI